MKGSPQRRLVGSTSSARQAAQGARSAARVGATRPTPSGWSGLAAIRTPWTLGKAAGPHWGIRGSSRAGAGSSAARRRRKHSSCWRGPDNSTSTPSQPLHNSPLSPSCVAS